MSVVGAAVIGGASRIAGNIIGNKGAASSAEDQRKWSEHMYKNRYQMQMADMKAAGLNPMLAAGQSPGAAPTGQKADFKSPTEGAFIEAASAAQLEKTESEIDTQQTVQDLNKANARKAAAEADLAESQKPWEQRKYDILNSVADVLSGWASNNVPTTADGVSKAVKELIPEPKPKSERYFKPKHNPSKSKNTTGQSYYGVGQSDADKQRTFDKHFKGK